MKQTLSYRGFIGSVEASPEDNCLFGKIEFTNDLVTYEGTTLKALQEAFRRAVDEYLDMCKRLAVPPEKPFKGTFNVRVGPELHRRAAAAARQQGLSLNELVSKAVRESLDDGGSPLARRSRRRVRLGDAAVPPGAIGRR